MPLALIGDPEHVEGWTARFHRIWRSEYPRRKRSCETRWQRESLGCIDTTCPSKIWAAAAT